MRSENAEIQAQNAEFQSQLLDELRALRVISVNHSSPAPLSPNPLQFGSIPSSEPSTSTVSAPSPIYPHGLGILSFTPGEISSGIIVSLTATTLPISNSPANTHVNSGASASILRGKMVATCGSPVVVSDVPSGLAYTDFNFPNHVSHSSNIPVPSMGYPGFHSHNMPAPTMGYILGNSFHGGSMPLGPSGASSYYPQWQANSSSDNVSQWHAYPSNNNGPQNRPTLPFAVNHYLTTQSPTQPHTVQAPATYSTYPTSYPQFHQPQIHNHKYQPQGAQFPLQPDMDPNLPTMRQMRLDFQTFGGGDPLHWLNKAEQYFDLYQIPEARRVAIAAMHLVDEAADVWHLFRHHYPGTWVGFTELLMREFGSHNRTDYQAALTKLSQSGTVSEFKSQFNKYARRAPGFSDDILLACFLGGLKEDISVDVRAMRPTSLYQAYELAMIFEERHMRQRGGVSQRVQVSSSTPTYNQRSTNFSSSSGRNSSLPSNRFTSAQGTRSNMHTSSSTSADRKLSQHDYHDRRARGLCFFCDEPYKGGHVCKKTSGQGRALLIEGIPEESELVTPPPELEEGDSEGTSRDRKLDELTVSLHVIGDIDNPRTMQLKGRYNNKSVHVLIDGGATHSFIHPSLLHNTSQQVNKLSSLKVVVATGPHVKTSGKMQLEMQLQGTPIDTEVFVLPINGCEVLLGASWLRTLGDIIWNYEKMTMKFSVQGREFMLQGILDNDTALVSGATMTKLLKQEKQAMLIQLMEISSADNGSLNFVDPAIVTLINKFATLFDKSTSLPPHRRQDHRIELLPGTTLVSVRPYRYPQFQKNEVEKICNELLVEKQIQHSTSPFSSPVILVKKKDGSNRMCVDYRSLNVVTVKDKFPIPVVDELLDELHGAVYFTKLDLRSGYHQIRMHPKDVHKTAFRTHQGHYEFLVMPFGLTPSTFQSLMNEVFHDFLRKFVLVFFDDILIYSKSLEEHLMHLSRVFSRLEDNQLKVKLSKCAFGTKSVEYLGHIISDKGVSVDPEKIEAIRNWKKRMTLKGLRAFLGLSGYYRKFCKKLWYYCQTINEHASEGQLQVDSRSRKSF
ncbi:putative nucleotidyltransferase, Ribonuclease H [Rosa chinensis]|uniref:Putative nucleotidyltransferase, Ribonuclease H n=3 Tax=Rosa chinensis TaxID=74649 RepID=A0A2P6Q7I6_ROSCH|nr:putative nucleotidyltransferase, Ribonuclease H [Rosa chinensis]